MGRFETLKPETQDMVNAMLPAIAASFKVNPENCRDIIPEDIRMRQWDCERRDHIKDKPEDDPRNWGVEFLKSIQAIARLNGNDLDAFQARLRELVAKHPEKHPWARLEDVRQIKFEYQNPKLRNPNGQDPESESSSDDSLDSYLEELVEQDLPKGTKRGHNEAYESRVQGWWKPAKPKKPKKPVRLRRDPDAGWDRRGKNKSKSRDVSQVSVDSDAADSVRESSPAQEPKRRRLTSKRPIIKKESPTVISDEESDDDVPIEVKALQAELETAEAELEVRRKKQMLMDAKVKAKAAKAAKAVHETPSGNAIAASQIGRTSVNDSTSYDSYDNGNGRNGHNNNNSGYTGFTGFTGSGDTNEHHGFRGFNGFTGSNIYSAYPLQTNYPARQDSQGHPAPEDYEQELDEEDSEDDSEDDSGDDEDSEE